MNFVFDLSMSISANSSNIDARTGASSKEKNYLQEWSSLSVEEQ